MQMLRMASIATMLCLSSLAADFAVATPTWPDHGDVFSIMATTGGYRLRTISSRSDQVVASCQLIRRGAWDYSVAVLPADARETRNLVTANLTVSGRWSYPLHRSASVFVWSAPDARAFALFLDRSAGMGWSDRFVSRDLHVDFVSHGTDDPGTIAAFGRLCGLADRRSGPSQP